MKEFCLRPGLLSDFAIEAIKTGVKELQEATVRTVGGREVVKKLRDAKICWLDENQFKPLYDHIYNELKKISSVMDFSFTEFQAKLQYTQYKPGGHYVWHPDWDETNGRVASFVIMLSNPNEYLGGEFQYYPNHESAKTVNMNLGDMIVFDSKIVHRVTPVTAGTRTTLVGWVK